MSENLTYIPLKYLFMIMFRIVGPDGLNSLRIHISDPSFDKIGPILCYSTSHSINPQRIEIQLVMIPYGFIPHNLSGSVQNQICSLNNTDYYGYIKRGSTHLSGTSSKPYHIACVRRAPKSLFGEALLAHTHLSHKPPTFRLGTFGYAGSPKPLEGTFRTLADQDVEGVVYTDHSGDDQRQNQQQQTLDLNATANEATGSGNANADSGGIQNGHPPPRNPIQGNRQSAFDRIGLSGPTQRPFGGIGSDKSQIAQELRHRMQTMELEVREFRKENVELRSSTRNHQPHGQTPPRRHSRSKSCSPPRRTQ
ncbi:hypothetical protein PIB30_037688 [Stylosanthes scabra]|uniref:Uncharacterized protein n=1 Tax=Stylosanthes scabra TaxID=79078 RepID=A0ABU6WDS7_9FABA|nr:hypothetical protein [Stylosanthes scabra]